MLFTRLLKILPKVLFFAVPYIQFLLNVKWLVNLLLGFQCLVNLLQQQCQKVFHMVIQNFVIYVLVILQTRCVN